MRITFILPPVDMSGGIRVIATYAEILHRRGHQVEVVSTREPYPTIRQIARSLLKAKRWPSLPRPKPPHLDGSKVKHRRLGHAGPVTDADVPDADVVIATWWETAKWVARLSSAKGVKVHFVQGHEIFGGPRAEVEAVYRLPMPKIVISSWLRDVMHSNYGQAPLALINNSVDADQFHAPPRGKQAVPTVGLIYTTQPVKGCDISIKAYEQAATELAGLRLLAMGNYAVAADLPLSPGTEFILQARGDTLRTVYARCDAWLSASREEGFGLPILEAMACRTPVIATPAGAAPELIGRGGGILVPPEDWRAMAEAIVKLCTLSEDHWRALSDAALGTATGYTRDDAANLFERALRQAVGSKTEGT